jgi:uncharacterized membrane protein
MFFLPFAVFNDGAGTITYLVFKGIVKINPSEWILISKNYILTTLICISLVLATAAIFSFKNRKNQIKLGWATLGILLLTSIYIFYYYFWIKSHFSITNSNINLASTFPIVSIVLTFLAIKAIKKDEKLVKSMDRIR